MENYEQLELLQNEVRRRAGHVVANYQGKIYMWGGYMEVVKTFLYDLMTPSSVKYHEPRDIWVYESLLNIWYKKSCMGSIPKSLSGSFFASFKNFLYVYGGYCFDLESENDGVRNILWRLDLDTLIWDRLSPTGCPPYPADKGTSWFYNDRFYLFGGYGSIAGFPIHQAPYSQIQYTYENNFMYGSKGWFDQLAYYDESNNKWVWPVCGGTPPSPRAAHAATMVGDTVYLFGGRHKELRLNDFYSLDLKTHVWKIIFIDGTSPLGRSWHTLTALSENTLVLYGGFSSECQVLNDIWLFNLMTRTWHEMTWMKALPRLWHCSLKIQQSEIMSIGGVSSNIFDDSSLKEHAEDMLCIRFSPPSLFRLVLEYLCNNTDVIQKARWNDLPTILKTLLEKRTDPLEIHGL